MIRHKQVKYDFPPTVFYIFKTGGPRSVMVTLLTLKQEDRGSNPGAAPPKSLEPKHPHTPPPGRKDASRVPERDGVRESRAPGMAKKNLAPSLSVRRRLLRGQPLVVHPRPHLLRLRRPRHRGGRPHGEVLRNQVPELCKD